MRIADIGTLTSLGRPVAVLGPQGANAQALVPRPREVEFHVSRAQVWSSPLSARFMGRVTFCARL